MIFEYIKDIRLLVKPDGALFLQKLMASEWQPFKFEDKWIDVPIVDDEGKIRRVSI